MRWDMKWRKETWETLNQEWDIIVIGGGITGAGILREAANAGLKTLLVEAYDFAFGTSSRSSKLIHGGFRYMSNGQFDVTYESVKEREWLLGEAKNLVTPLQFLVPLFKDGKMKESSLKIGTIIYDIMAKKWKHQFLSGQQTLAKCSIIRQEGLEKGVTYYDAQMDDSRFVLRIIREAVMAGATAINYTKVTQLLKDDTGRVNGVVLVDQSGEEDSPLEIRAKVVINATGPWSDEVRSSIRDTDKIRKLRGCHLVFPFDKFPLNHAVTLLHPDDGRLMFAIPWEGTVLVGTTDLDHPQAAGRPGNETCCTMEEIDYLLSAIEYTFPNVQVGKKDIISTMAGLRPIISSGAENPSDESRAHEVWDEDGLINIGGGKITIFRIMAIDVLNLARKYLEDVPEFKTNQRFFEPLPETLVANDMDDCFDLQTMNYLLGRYGLELGEMLAVGKAEELCQISPLPNIWAEVRWCVKSEAVLHLDDLLLRRVRLGLLLPNGGEEVMPKVKSIFQEEMKWTDEQWNREYQRYRDIWEQAYAPIPRDVKLELEGG